ncbi:hypothetical protein BGX27_011530, partial [Mortierella sp. AM989]
AGDCGCDECVSDMAYDIRNRMRSYRAQLAQIGKPRIPIYMVLQAFYDPAIYWSRVPTPVEFKVMSYVSLIHGAKGLVSWLYPGNMDARLKQSIATLSAELVPLASRFIIGGKQTLEYTNGNIVAGVWVRNASKLFIIINIGSRPVMLTDAQIKDIFGDDGEVIGVVLTYGLYGHMNDVILCEVGVIPGLSGISGSIEASTTEMIFK